MSLSLLRSKEATTVLLSNCSFGLTPYSISSVAGKYHQLFCEDLQSLGAKLDLAQANTPAGVFFWAENYVPHNYPFWKVVDQRYRVSPPANHVPVVSFGTPSAIVKDQPATLNGSATDQDGDGMILQWALTSGPRPLTFTAANGTSLVFTPHDWGYHQFSLTATDGLLTGSGATTILVPGDTVAPALSWTAPASCVDR